MRRKWAILWITTIVMLLFANVVNAQSVPVSNVDITQQVQIPESVKNIDDLVDYLMSKGVIKTLDDLYTYMKNNKQVIINLKPGLIDFGFTYRMYVETDQFRDDGIIKLTHEYGLKEVKIWVVPFSLSNYTDETLEISKEIIALVPKHIPEGSEKTVLAIEPEYIMDATNGNFLGKFEFPPHREVYLNAVFYVYPLTFAESVNLRVYDGKDHVDLGIAKPE